jgi:beta-lactamase regulating signal transducer with metallopeptidase domain/outer membrane protein assembly factor BamB
MKNTLLSFAWPFSEAVVECLGWALVHSLWQFALVTLLASLAVRAMQQTSSKLRYGVLVTAMVVSVAAPMATWLLVSRDIPSSSPVAIDAEPHLKDATDRRTDVLRLASAALLASDEQRQSPAPESAASETQPVVLPQTTAILEAESSWSERTTSAVRPWLAWIVAGWSLGVVVCSARPLLGWWTLRRLKRVGVSPVPDQVLAALDRVSERLGLRGAVQLLQSTLAQVPIVVGYFRPVILLPVSLVTSIPASQLEAILAHELAHVQRHDFVVNLLQTLVETLFFYHPAVWWLSRQIRMEREHCCDDLVVKLLDNRVEYGRALVAIEQQRGKNSVLALGATDGSLLSRVRRIVGPNSEHTATSLVERWPAALLGIVLIGVLTVLSLTWNLAAQDEPKPKSLPPSKSERYVVDLPNGPKIELVGVCKNAAPARDGWTPDGRPIGEVEGWDREPRTTIEKRADGGTIIGTQGTPSPDARDLLVKITGLKTQPTITLNSFPGAWGRYHLPISEPYHNRIGILLHQPSASHTFRLGITDEPWGMPQQISPTGELLNKLDESSRYWSSYQQIKLVRAGPLADDEQNTELTVEWPKNHAELFAFEIKAIDSDGKDVWVLNEREGINEEGQNTARFILGDKIPRERLARFEYRLRPYRHWVTFENVSLQPDHKTEVKVKVETVSDGKPVKASSIQTGMIRPGEWPMWGRSSHRNHVASGEIPTEWDLKTGRNVLWKAKLGSATYASPIVSDGKVFIGTNNAAALDPRQPKQKDLSCLVCFDQVTGKLLWQFASEKLPQGRVHDWPEIGLCSTACVVGDRLWVATNRCEVVCLDTEGFRDGENDGEFIAETDRTELDADVVWKFDMFNTLGVRPLHQAVSSIAVVDGVVLLNTSNGPDESRQKVPAPNAPHFLALDARTGRVVWQDNSAGESILVGGSACSCSGTSPAVAKIGGVTQAIFAGREGWLYGFDFADLKQGKTTRLWQFDCNPKTSKYFQGGQSTRNTLVASPVVVGDRVFIATGRNPEDGEGPGDLWCIDANKRGDISSELVFNNSHRDGQEPIPHKPLFACDPKLGDFTRPNPNSGAIWHYVGADRNGDGKLAFDEAFHRSISSPTIHDGMLFIPDFSGLLHCVDARTGEGLWTHDLLAAVWSSCVIADGKVLIGDEDGEIAIFNATRTYQPLPNDDPANFGAPIYSTPAVTNRNLFVATKDMLVAIGGEQSKAAAKETPKNREQIGEVLGKPVYRDEVQDDTLQGIFLSPVLAKYQDAHRAAITPTEDELKFATEYFDKEHRKRLDAAGGEAKIREQMKAIEERLARTDLPDDEQQKLELEHRVLQHKLKLPGRVFAQFMLNNWKFQKHLYEEFGGGRILWQQAGVEAFDATRICLESLEKKGEFKITDATLRAKLFDYWTRSHGSFLTDDKERIRREFLEPEWIAPAAAKASSR